MDIRPILVSLRRHKIASVLVVLEIALTCAIVCNAVFLVRQRLARMDMPSGVAEHELVVIRVAGGAHVDDHGKSRTAADLAALSTIPGVVAATATNQLPFGNGSWDDDVKLDPRQKNPTLTATEYYGVDLLKTLGLRLVAGRGYAPDEYVDLIDLLEHKRQWPPTVIVTRALAQRLWPDQDALGKPLYGVANGDNPVRVVGVVASLVRPSLNDGDATAQWSMILPVRVLNSGPYVLRTTPDLRQRVIKAAVAKLKANGPRRTIMYKQSFDEVRADFFRGDRAMAGLLMGVIVALLVVTALGIVGLASFWVSQRRHTIGVRRALGATRRNILHYFQVENFLLATFGIALGMVLAYGINLFLMLHYELPRLPAIYFPVGAVLLWGIGQLAVLGPALRASRVPPVVATRSV